MDWPPIFRAVIQKQPGCSEEQTSPEPVMASPHYIRLEVTI